MNIQRLKLIADYLRNPDADRKVGFNMCSWRIHKDETNPDLLGPSDCNTVCCIAGLACALYPGYGGAGGFQTQAAEILELDPHQAIRLFHGGALSLADISVKMVIETIDKLIRTGEVIWSNER